MPNRDDEGCPECGGKMVDGEYGTPSRCEDCDHVENANPQGCNQYKPCSGSSGGAEKASKAAAGASESARGTAGHNAAADAHKTAAAAHLEAGKRQISKGNDKAALKHLAKAQDHDEAAAGHAASSSRASAGGRASARSKQMERDAAASPGDVGGGGHTGQVEGGSSHDRGPSPRAERSTGAAKAATSGSYAGGLSKTASSAEEHGAAAEAHRDAAKKSKDPATSAAHRAMAQHHDAEASGSHITGNRDTNGGENMWQTTNMEAGGAFQGAKEAGYSSGEAAAMAGKAEGSYEGASGGGSSAMSQKAATASKSANSKGTPEAHRDAAKAHDKAATTAKHAGNKDMQEHHVEKAQGHREKANKAMSFNNQTVLNELVANGCVCEADRGRAMSILNAMPAFIKKNIETGKDDDDDDDNNDDDGNPKRGTSSSRQGTYSSRQGTLPAAFQRNADGGKAIGSNADLIGTAGTIQAGGEEDTDSDDFEFPDRAQAGVKKGKATMNRWMRDMPEEAREVWNNAVAVERSERIKLIKRITVNMADGQRKVDRQNGLMRKPMAELRDMLELLPPVRNQRPEPVPLYFGAAGTQEIVDNRNDGASDDTLDLPAMNYAEETSGKRQTA